MPTISTPTSVGPLYLTQEITIYFSLSDMLYKPLTATGVPPGLTFEMGPGAYGKGILKGTPTTLGTYTMTVSGVNSADAIAPKSYTIEVRPQPDASIKLFFNIGAPLYLKRKVYIAIATHPDQGPLQYFPIKAEGLPPGLTLANATKGMSIISGVPTVAGTYSVLLTGVNAADKVKPLTWPLEVRPAEANISNASLPTIHADDDFIAKISVFPLDTPLQAVGLPAGLSLDAAGNQIVGKISASEGDTYSITISAPDESYGLTPKTFTGVVASPRAPLLYNRLLATMRSAYEPYRDIIYILGASTGKSVTVEGFPSFVDVINDSNKRLSLRPLGSARAGVYPITFTMSNDIGSRTETRNFYVFSNAPHGNPSITTSSIPPIFFDEFYSVQLESSGVYPVIWKNIDPLPHGLTITPDGLISGVVPYTSEDDRITVFTASVSGPGYPTDYGSFSVEYQDNFRLEIVQSKLEQAKATVPYSLQLFARGGQGDIRWEMDSDAAGISISSGGLITGAVEEPGEYPIEIRAYDSKGREFTRGYTLFVGEAPKPEDDGSAWWMAFGHLLR